jgi:hypothetical protein
LAFSLLPSSRAPEDTLFKNLHNELVSLPDFFQDS